MINKILIILLLSLNYKKWIITAFINAQYKSLIELTKKLFKIHLAIKSNIIDHSNIAAQCKKASGSGFDWTYFIRRIF